MVALFQKPAGANKCERLSAGSAQSIVYGARETLRVDYSSMCAHAQTITRATIRLIRQLKSRLNETPSAGSSLGTERHHSPLRECSMCC